MNTYMKVWMKKLMKEYVKDRMNACIKEWGWEMNEWWKKKEGMDGCLLGMVEYG